jgi:hypothetical protein
MPVQSHLQSLIESIHQRALSEPPAELQEFAKEETLYQPAGQERRRHRRFSLITNVIVVPIDERFRPIDDPFVSLSSGMSVDGIRLIHTEPSPSDCLFIEIESQPVRFVLSVVRNRPLGSCFEIAGRLMSVRELSPQIAPPSVEEMLHWAGVTAAVPLLAAHPTGLSLHA